MQKYHKRVSRPSYRCNPYTRIQGIYIETRPKSHITCHISYSVRRRTGPMNFTHTSEMRKKHSFGFSPMYDLFSCTIWTSWEQFQYSIFWRLFVMSHKGPIVEFCRCAFCILNIKAIRIFQHPISRVRYFARFDVRYWNNPLNSKGVLSV